MKKYRIAIVGAGPAGYFTAQAFQDIQNSDISFLIDIIEKLPTPWGLVRSGVAPDHQKIKSVSKVFEKIAQNPNFRLFANVEVGKDISIKKLRSQYDVVVLATGAPKSRRLGIVGEDISNVFSATEFVSWYNSHPEFSNLNPDLSCETAVIIGTGNVALDIARILSKDPALLTSTDIADYALKKLQQSKIRQIIVCGRRGPEHVAFKLLEIRDLIKLKNSDIKIDNSQITQSISRLTKSNYIEKETNQILMEMKLISENKLKFNERSIELKFLVKPQKIIGNNRVEMIDFSFSKIIGNEIKDTTEIFSIKTGLIISAIGYESEMIPGVTLENSRIQNIAGQIESNLYVTGWAKRGSNGVIGTNKSDARDVVKLIVNNLDKPKYGQSLPEIIGKNHHIVDLTGWNKINMKEINSGIVENKPRIKIYSKEELIKVSQSD